MRRLLILPAVLVCVLLAPAAASARPLVVGIGDQNPVAYQDPQMHALKQLQVARLTLAWDWYKTKKASAHANWWMSTVRAAGMRPLVTFNRNWRRKNGKRVIPPLKDYLKSLRLFRERFPEVTEFSAWNEPNAPEQPFYRKPKTAARFFNAMRKACTGCTVLAGDINDASNMLSWLRVYKRHIRGAKVWALHNYRDITAHTVGTTRLFLRNVRGPVWLTETGAIKRRGGLKGQVRSVKRAFALARSSRRIQRLYFYEWRAAPRRHWDSAFLSANGKRRPAYFALRKNLRRP